MIPTEEPVPILTDTEILTSFTRISLAVITDAARLLEIAVLFLKITFPV
jgi:hypothetical protein